VIDERLLKNEEIAITKFRSLYEQYGYKPYKMSKFEEYELYVANKDFLVSDRVITFNDTNGKLLALKPDVTLSIIKNMQSDCGIQKLYYNENVYRVSQSTNCFKEIMQTGLECIGNIGIYEIYEVIMLASKSLLGISNDFVIEVSNLSIIENAINSACDNQLFKEKALKFIESKNSHDLVRLCDEYNVEKNKIDAILALIGAYGNRNDVIKTLKKYFNSSELNDIESLSKLFDLLPFANNIIFDFSVAGNTNYYNGFVFRGFIKGINERVLAGGQYDKMMQKMSKKIGAIGFAIYLDLLEELSVSKSNKCIECAIVYDDKTKTEDIVKISDDMMKKGKNVSVLKDISNVTYQELIDIRGNENA